MGRGGERELGERHRQTVEHAEEGEISQSFVKVTTFEGCAASGWNIVERGGEREGVNTAARIEPPPRRLSPGAGVRGLFGVDARAGGVCGAEGEGERNIVWKEQHQSELPRARIITLGGTTTLEA